MIDATLHKQAERWLEAMMWRWDPTQSEPLPIMPARPTQRVRLALDAGIDEWAGGSREELIYAAAARFMPSKEAFLTLALNVWPDDILNGDNFWLLPYQLAFVYAGIELGPYGLPDGVAIGQLPQTSRERAEERAALRAVEGGPKTPAGKQEVVAA